MRQILMILIVMLLTCCSSETGMRANTNQAQSNIGKTLIVFYSYTGNCREIVSSLESKITADQLEILPAEKGLQYDADNYALGTQLLNTIKANPTDADSYPDIDPVTVELAEYDNIIIVTPLWWSQMAAIMQTFLFQNSAKLAGKTVTMIVSSYSSGISGVVADARRLLPDATWAGDALWINNDNYSDHSSLIEKWLSTQNFKKNDDMTQKKIYLTIGSVTQSATLVNNSSTKALLVQLQNGDITYVARDYGGFEKVGALGCTFPENNEQISTVPGDLILYMGNSLCIYYDTNSWNFTRIGKLDNMTQDEIKTFVNAGGGNVNVTISLADTTSGISMVNTDETKSNAFTMQGMFAKAGAKGVVIQNGKKIIR